MFGYAASTTLVPHFPLFRWPKSHELLEHSFPMLNFIEINQLYDMMIETSSCNLETAGAAAPVSASQVVERGASRCRRAVRKRPRFFEALAILIVSQSVVMAQEIGLDICACQPSVYEFTLDFELTCDDLDVGGPGISDTTCLTELRGQEDQDGADLVPVTVSQVSIFELDQNLDVIAQTVKTGSFLSGSTFTYTSIIATEPDMLNPNSLPRGIQLVFIGNNAMDQAVVNTFAILYNNDCGVFPLLREGQVAGWSIFVSRIFTSLNESPSSR